MGAHVIADRAPLDDPFHTLVEVGREHPITLRLGIDQHVGGFGDLPNPGDLLCAALAACEDGTIRMIANVLGVRLTALAVKVQRPSMCAAAWASIRTRRLGSPASGRQSVSSRRLTPRRD